jgi:hypothetical protein
VSAKNNHLAQRSWARSIAGSLSSLSTGETPLPLSLYEVSIPLLIRGLNNLSAVLKKGEQFAADKKIDPAILIQARLAPDMLALPAQVQIACDTAKGCAARLAGLTAPSFADTEASFPELQARIAKTIAFLQSVGADKIDGNEERSIVLKFPSQELKFIGRDYLRSFVLPNFYFHVTTAYGILRHQGVALGKRDYMGG